MVHERPSIPSDEAHGAEQVVEPEGVFHGELEAIERELVKMAGMCDRALGRGLDALTTSDYALAADVVARDEDIDRLYQQVHQRWLDTMLLQLPTPDDLRRMTAAFHILVTLERMGDQAANLGKIVQAARGSTREPMILSHLRRMGALVRPMVRTATDAFANRDLDAARRLPEMDEPVNRLNRSMAHEVALCASNQQVLEWAVHMLMVARALERVGDQAVDIGEQVAFLLTGEFQEFTRRE